MCPILYTQNTSSFGSIGGIHEAFGGCGIVLEFIFAVKKRVVSNFLII